MIASLRVLAPVSILLLLAGCAPTAMSVAPALRTEAAPSGKLRVGVVSATPQMKGVAVDIGREMASRLGVPVELVRYETANSLWAGIARSEWDVASLAIDPQRASDMNFTSAYLYLGDRPVALAIPRGRSAAFAYAYELVEDLKASGFVGEAISREGLAGARVAPARAK